MKTLHYKVYQNNEKQPLNVVNGFLFNFKQTSFALLVSLLLTLNMYLLFEVLHFGILSGLEAWTGPLHLRCLRGSWLHIFYEGPGYTYVVLIFQFPDPITFCFTICFRLYMHKIKQVCLILFLSLCTYFYLL